MVQASEAEGAPVSAVRVTPAFTQLSSILQVVNTSLEALQWSKTTGSLAVLPSLRRGRLWIRARREASLGAMVSAVKASAQLTCCTHCLLTLM